MNSRERLHRCYTHQDLDRPGVFIRAGWPGDPSYTEVKAWVNAHTDRKITVDLQSLHTRPKTTVLREHHSDDFAKETVLLHTPKGDLRSVTLVGLRLLPGFCQEHLLKTPEDVEKYLSLPLPEPTGDASAFQAADRNVGESGIADAYLGYNPGGFIAELFGSETFADFSVNDRELLHQLCQRQQTVTLNLLKHALSLGIGPYFSLLGHEMIVPPLHGPADFADFCTRYDKPLYDAVHNAGGRIHVHCHSKVATVFQQFVDAGVDVLHPFEPPPMGDITARQAKSLAGDKLCLEGNLQISNMYEHTPAQIADETSALIADAFTDRKNLIVCPTASFYQVGKGAECFAQIKAMVETVLACKA